jgi:hypothetical protein
MPVGDTPPQRGGPWWVIELFPSRPPEVMREVRAVTVQRRRERNMLLFRAEARVQSPTLPLLQLV